MNAKILQCAGILTCALLMSAVSAGIIQADELPYWKKSKSKDAIINFVENVTKEGSPDYIPPADRIAVFDNDGTLWAEQPIYFQFAFAIDRIKALAPKNPEWKDKQPFKSILNGDLHEALAGGEKSVVAISLAAHSGMSTEEFEKIVREWVYSAKHPKSEKLYTDMVYQPMVELLSYLRKYGFKTYIVSGGGVEFMRPWVEDAYGIPPEQVIGSRGKMKFEIKDGTPSLLKLPEIDFVDDGPGKPANIQQIIGRRPVMAFGNSDGDLQMLQWTCAGKGARFCLYVHHTDNEREWAYDRNSKIGKLDKGLDEAAKKGWTVVDMKNDWNVVFKG